MRTIKGDLIALALQGAFDVIIHGCNCHCTMGAGIARLIRKEFPEAYEADCRTEPVGREKLGTLSSALCERESGPVTVVNGYTQYDYSGSGVLVDYEAVRSVMRGVKEQFSGRRIGYPKIGAGLAGGDWTVISQIIDEELDGEDHTLVEYVLNV